jgi:DNA topoisomerase-1
MAGLTAKVFRTYNASYTMARLLKELKASGTIQEKVKAYNDANREVAILCNHKRTVAAGHAGSIEKMQERVGYMCVLMSLRCLTGSRLTVFDTSYGGPR